MRYLIFALLVFSLPLNAFSWWPFSWFTPAKPVDQYEQCLQDQLANPYDPLVNYNLGVLAAKRGDIPLAQASFDRVIKEEQAAGKDLYSKSSINAGHLMSKNATSVLEALHWKEKKIAKDVLNEQLGKLDQAIDYYSLVEEDFDPAQNLSGLKRMLQDFKRAVIERQKELEKHHEDKKNQDKNQQQQGGNEKGQDENRDQSQQSDDNGSGDNPPSGSGDKQKNNQGQPQPQKHDKNKQENDDQKDQRSKDVDHQKDERQSAENEQKGSGEGEKNQGNPQDQNQSQDQQNRDDQDQETQNEQKSEQEQKDQSSDGVDQQSAAEQEQQQGEQQDGSAEEQKDHKAGDDAKQNEAPFGQENAFDKQQNIPEQADERSVGKEESSGDVTEEKAAEQKANGAAAAEKDDSGKSKAQAMAAAQASGSDDQKEDDQYVMWHDEHAKESQSEKMARMLLQRLEKHESSLHKQRLAHRSRYSAQTSSPGQKNW